jgi:hypothetical protein
MVRNGGPNHLRLSAIFARQQPKQIDILYGYHSSISDHAIILNFALMSDLI